MIAYILKRLLHSVYVILAISLIVFIAVRLTGDPVSLMFGDGQPSKEAVASIRHNLGLDKPVYVQYLIFLKNLFTLNLGTSYRTGESVAALVFGRMGATLTLAIAGIVMALLISVPIGILTAVKRNSLWDYAGRVLSLIGISFPNFWLGIMLILIFSVSLHWFPASGYSGFSYLILPSLTLGLVLSGTLSRLIRTSMLQVMNEQFVSTAQSKGLSQMVVIMRHVLRNSLIPLATFLGIEFGSLLGGTVIIEQIFAWPGVGQLIVGAISQRDFPVIQGGVMVLAMLMVLVNLAVDISYSFIDPRIRIEGR
jgi:peptide/nickel transport system permease protein